MLPPLLSGEVGGGGGGGGGMLKPNDLSLSHVALRHNDSLNDEVRQFNSKFDERFGLEHFTYNNSAMLNVIQENIANTDFAGLTVSVHDSD